jgi:putative spermidine/putrescine transport system permease protein
MTTSPILRVGRAFAIGAAILCLLPIPLLVAVSTTSNWPLGFWAEGFTLHWLSDAWTRLAPRLVFSVQLALIVLILDMLIGLPAAYALARGRFTGKRLLNSLVTLPLGVPGIAIALALILAYPSAKSSGALLIVGQVLYTLPFLVSAVTPALAQPKLLELERVAATLGASRPRQLIMITLPAIRSALLAAVIMVITLSLGEFNISFFLFTSLNQPLPVELYSAYITGRIEVAAALTLWFIVLTLPAAIAIERLGGGRVGQA